MPPLSSSGYEPGHVDLLRGHRNDCKSGTAKTRVWGLYPQWGSKGQRPFGGGQGAKPPEASAFSKMR